CSAKLCGSCAVLQMNLSPRTTARLRSCSVNLAPGHRGVVGSTESAWVTRIGAQPGCVRADTPEWDPVAIAIASVEDRQRINGGDAFKNLLQAWESFKSIILWNHPGAV